MDDDANAEPPPGAPRSDPEPPSLRATTSRPPPRPRRPGSTGARVGAGLLMLALATLFFAPKITRVLSRPLAVAPAPSAEPTAVVSAAPAVAEPAIRADAELSREGRSSVAVGSLVVLPDFASADGKFDLILHFHGGTEIVTQSYGAAHLNAVVVVFNLGIGSRVYDEYWGYPPRLTQIIELAEHAMHNRKLENAKARRVALSAFSAGFGGVDNVLKVPGAIDAVDAVILLDGLHAGYDDHHKIDIHRIDPILEFARAAVAGKKLLYITHSAILTNEYASTTDTSAALLEELGVRVESGGETPAILDLPALGGPTVTKDMKWLEPESHAEKGGLFVRGFKGAEPQNHLAHMNQMSTTAAPRLAQYWSEKR